MLGFGDPSAVGAGDIGLSGSPVALLVFTFAAVQRAH
jgi:hypothetical protein